MLKGRDTGCSYSQQHFSVRHRWFWKIYKLQPFIATELFCSHGTHVGSPVFLKCVYALAAGRKPEISKVDRDQQQVAIWFQI